MRRVDPRTILRWAPPIILFGALAAMRLLGDRWWPLLPLLFGPRWLLGLLVPIPLLALSRRGWRPTVIATLAGALVYLALIDFRVPWRALIPHGNGASTPVRVLSWNARGGGGDLRAAVAMLTEWHPDITIIAECGPELAAVLKRLPDETFHQSDDVCLVSRLPIAEWLPRPPNDFWRIGGAGAIAKAVVSVGGREVVVGGVHLETPREALQELFFLDILSFRSMAIASQSERDLESEVARNWIAPAEEERPLIVAGDFNLVRESAIFSRWWGDLTDAFAVRGFGLGWTKELRWFGARIDHVLVAGGITVRRVAIGAPTGSDHRPVIADLRVPVANDSANRN